MIHEGDLVALRRKAEVADPSLALIQNMTNGILDLIAALGMVDDSQFAVRIPVCPRNVFEDLSRGTARERAAGQRAPTVSRCAR